MIAALNILKRQARENWRVGLAGAAGTAFLGLTFLTMPFGEGLSDLSYDLPYYFRGNRPALDVALVYVDHDTHTQLKQTKSKQLDRALHTNVIRRLRESQARAIVFDMHFAATNDSVADDAFVSAVRAAGNVAVGAMEVPEIIDGRPIGWQLQEPFPELQEAVATWGVVEADHTTFRRHFAGSGLRPSLAWKVAELTMTNPPPAEARRWINYYGPPGHIPHHSYYDVYRGVVPSSAFSNKVVFVGGHYHAGFLGGKGTDDYTTPYTRWLGTKAPGVEINATVYQNLRRGDWLRRLSPVKEALLISALGLCFGFGLALSRPLIALSATLLAGALVATFSIISVWQTHTWYSWLIVCAVQLPAALAWSTLVYSQRLARERDFLERQLAGQPGMAPTTLSPAAPGHVAVGEGLARLSKAAAGLSSFFNSPGVALGEKAVPPPLSAETPAIPDHTLLRRIGRGSYGEVWLAQDIIGTFHAVKIIHRHSFDEPAPYEREFHGIRKFTPVSRSHPGLVHILHVGRNEVGEYIYYVMELADDETAGQHVDPQTYAPRNLAKDLKKRTRLPLEECLQLSLDLAAALEHLHSNQLIHRDIKPANIIFVKGAPKFADIGLVTDLAGSARSVTCLGTQGYIAPEGPGTAAADVYSLGKVIYEAAVGLDRARFPELPTALLESDTPPQLFELNKVILRACETEVRNRFRSAADLHAELLRIQVAVRRR